jgi:ATP-dependent DNA ligase
VTKRQKRSGSGRPATAKRFRPAFIGRWRAQAVRKLPEGDEWLYEVKLDGYRGLLIKDGSRVESAPVRTRTSPGCTRPSARHVSP